MKLIYTYTSKLSNRFNFEKTIEIYIKSYQNNIRFHDIVLYTDKESKILFQDVFQKIKLFEVEDIIFTDDYKYSVLKNLSCDEILFDGDIFLTHPLIINDSYDVLCESFVGSIIKNNYYNYYLETIQILIKNNIMVSTPILEFVPNIGILKFQSNENMKEFLMVYHSKRKKYIDMGIENKFNLISKDFRSCAVFGQYFLGEYINDKKLKVGYVKENNFYSHLGGDQKYNISFKKTLI